MAFDSTPDDLPLPDGPTRDGTDEPRPKRDHPWFVIATLLVLGLFVFIGPVGAVEQLQNGLANVFDASGGCGGP